MSRARFEEMLKRRTSRRMAVASGAAGLIGLSLPGRPTLAMARQGATPEATPVDLSRKPSATFGAYPFQLGVASGDPLPNGVVLWTRLAPSPIDGGGMDPVPYDVRWEVARDESFSDIVQTGLAVADPNLAHSVHVDVTGLEPHTEYFYRFMVGDEVSETGRTVTAPAPGQPVDSLRFGVASCANYEDGYFVAYRDMAEQRFDTIFHLGDYIYEVDPSREAFRQAPWTTTYVYGEPVVLQGYRNRFGIYHTDADLRAVRASAPMIVTWDDHEVEDNYAGEHPTGNIRREEFLQRRADAYQAYYEHMPLRPWSMPVGPDMTLYRSLAFGDLMQINVLDTRQYRDDQPSGNGIHPRTPASVDPNTTMLGPDQERWLLDKLTGSNATWNVMAQQVLLAETYFPVADGDAIAFYNDSWTGYPAARQRILQHIVDAQVPNPVVLTGDMHTSWAADVLLDWDDPSATPIGSEFICTSITAGGIEPSSSLGAYEEGFDYMRFYDPRHGGYSALEVTEDLFTCRFRLVENMQQPDSPVIDLATWVTEKGNPGVQQG